MVLYVTGVIIAAVFDPDMDPVCALHALRWSLCFELQRDLLSIVFGLQVATKMKLSGTFKYVSESGQQLLQHPELPGPRGKMGYPGAAGYCRLPSRNSCPRGARGSAQ
jgi:hypothetical protein